MKCPSCGIEVSESARFCASCGASLARSEKETEAVALNCKNCGSKLPEGAVYCTSCGTPVAAVPSAGPMPEAGLRLAGWRERFIAWLIDIIIVGIILSPVKWFLLWAAWPGFVWAPDFLRWIPFVDFGLDNVIYFLYWTIMEGSGGRSIGKMIMNALWTNLGFMVVRSLFGLWTGRVLMRDLLGVGSFFSAWSFWRGMMKS